jgi:ketosteroid isomerase-like protein
MSADHNRLESLATDFFAAFNRNDGDAAMAFFADSAVYEDANGVRHNGKAGVGAAFAPLFAGDFGPYEFVIEDMLVDANTNSVLARFLCNMAPDGQAMAWRGVDLLYFQGDKIIKKMAYCKATEMFLEAA